MAKLLTKIKFRMNKRQVKKAVEQAVIDPLQKCALLVETEAKTLLSKGGGQYQRDQHGRFIQGSKVEKGIPSKPGDPPHAQTGNLRGSIRHAATSRGTYVIGPTTTAFYGRIHEFGGTIRVSDKMRGFLMTKGIYLRKTTQIIHIPARPFMRPALDNTRKKFPMLFKNIPISKTSAGRDLNSKEGKDQP